MVRRNYPQAYIDFLVHFHGTRDYFECHEILEEYWKKSEPKNRQSVWVALIQLSVALYHQRIGNFKGALRTLEKAVHLIHQKKDSIHSLGIDSDGLLAILDERLKEINNELPYYSIHIPITDKNLLQECMDNSLQKGVIWNSPSDLSNQFLLYKHRLRDRTEVINERTSQLLKRKNERPYS